jgi:catechol 2,3-dioxygenase-like lactoylglutathione lyase family enzyme
MPARISALALVVPDYDLAVAFYVGDLGFRLTADIDQGRKRWVTVEPPGGGPALVLARAEGAAQKAAIGNQTGGRVFLFLETDDFARDHAAMLAAGVTFEEAPRHEPYGTVAVWRDPFGNRWDLLERR